MGHSGWFKASAATAAEWERQPDLAEVCEAAGLTVREARIVLLYCLGLSYSQIGSALALGDRYKVLVGRSLYRALNKLGQACPGERATSYSYGRVWAADVLSCLRNRRLGGTPARPMIGRDDFGRVRVWNFRSRPFGTVPEDLVRLEQEGDADSDTTPQEVSFLLALAERLRWLKRLRAAAVDRGLTAAERDLFLNYAGHLRSVADLAHEEECSLVDVARRLDALEARLGPYVVLLQAADVRNESGDPGAATKQVVGAEAPC